MRDIEHDKLELKIQGLKAEQETGFMMVEIALKDIKKVSDETLEQTKKTNGRVTQLEDDYLIIRTLRKHKWLVLLVSIGIFKLYEMIDLQWLFNKLISLF